MIQRAYSSFSLCCGCWCPEARALFYLPDYSLIPGFVCLILQQSEQQHTRREMPSWLGIIMSLVAKVKLKVNASAMKSPHFCWYSAPCIKPVTYPPCAHLQHVFALYLHCSPVLKPKLLYHRVAATVTMLQNTTIFSSRSHYRWHFTGDTLIRNIFA